MEPVLITQKAKWNLQELLPILIFIGFAALSVLLGITTVFSEQMTIFSIAVSLGLAAYIYYVSSKRKHRSTLFAKVTNDENLNIEVWMRKPLKDKWQGKLDEGKNKGKLSRIRSIKVEDIRGSRTLVISTLDGKPVFIPVRLAETDEMRKLLAKAVELKGGKVTFDSAENAKEFKAILAGQPYTPPPAALKEWEDPNNRKLNDKLTTKHKDVAKKEERAEKIAAASAPEAEPVALVEQKPARHVTVIDYSRYGRVPTSDIITNALIDAEEKAAAADKEDDKPAVNAIDIDPFLGGSTGTSTVSIDLTPNK